MHHCAFIVDVHHAWNICIQTQVKAVGCVMYSESERSPRFWKIRKKFHTCDFVVVCYYSLTRTSTSMIDLPTNPVGSSGHAALIWTWLVLLEKNGFQTTYTYNNYIGLFCFLCVHSKHVFVRVDVVSPRSTLSHGREESEEQKIRRKNVPNFPGNVIENQLISRCAYLFTSRKIRWLGAFFCS